MEQFNYLEHYKTDALEFDYFEERKGATLHDERRVREFILSLVPKSSNLILDVGCGSAWVAESLLKLKRKIISLDISTANPKKAFELFPSSYHYPLCGDSFYLPLKNNSVDCIIASEIIEHVINPQKFIDELLRVVKPAGSLIITTPYKEKLQYYLCIHCNKKTPVHAHIHSFDEKKLQSYIIDKKNISFKFFTFGNKILIFLRTYVLLKYFPFFLWKIIDRLFNKIYNRPAHILAVYTKK